MPNALMDKKTGDHLPFAATWDLAYICNYRCPYCFIDWKKAGLGVRHSPVLPQDWTDFWKRLHDQYGRFNITLAGGEPFVYPGIVQLLGQVSQWHVVNVCTNLSWSPELVIGVLDAARVRFSCSFHPHFAQLEEFTARLGLLKRSGYVVMASVVAYPSYFDQWQGYKESFEKSGVKFYFQPFQGSYAGKEYPKSYSADQRRFLYGAEFLPGELMEHPMKERAPLGRLCAAGQKRFRVTVDGSIRRCAPAMRLKEAPLGHIKDAVIRLFDAAKPCPAEACFCPEEFGYLLDLDVPTPLF